MTKCERKGHAFGNYNSLCNFNIVRKIAKYILFIDKFLLDNRFDIWLAELLIASKIIIIIIEIINENTVLFPVFQFPIDNNSRIHAWVANLRLSAFPLLERSRLLWVERRRRWRRGHKKNWYVGP